MIGRRGERGSGISVLATRHDDDDFIVISIRSNLLGPIYNPNKTVQTFTTDN